MKDSSGQNQRWSVPARRDALRWVGLLVSGVWVVILISWKAIGSGDLPGLQSRRLCREGGAAVSSILTAFRHKDQC